MIRLLIAMVSVQSLFVMSAMAQTGSSNLGLSSNEPVQVDGDRLEILEDQAKAIFDGNVSVVQGKTVLRTSKLTIFYKKKEGETGSIATGGSEIESLLATGGVNIQSGNQVATGETGTYDMDNEILVLSGKRVTLSEGGNVATGCKLTVTMSNNRARLEGCGNSGSRPTVLIQPKSN